jgi:hypothetical protein
MGEHPYSHRIAAILLINMVSNCQLWYWKLAFLMFESEDRQLRDSRIDGKSQVFFSLQSLCVSGKAAGFGSFFFGPFFLFTGHY